MPYVPKHTTLIAACLVLGSGERALLHDGVDDPEVDRLARLHEEIAVHRLLDRRERLPRVLSEEAIQPVRMHNKLTSSYSILKQNAALEVE